MPAKKEEKKKVAKTPAVVAKKEEKKKKTTPKKESKKVIKAPAAKKSKNEKKITKKTSAEITKSKKTSAEITKSKKTGEKVKLTQKERINLIIQQQRPVKCYRIGQDLPPSGIDMTRLVKWPKYIRMQRQKRILLGRLKMPPPLNHFNHTLEKTTAIKLFKILHKYRPEEKHQKKIRRLNQAKLIATARKSDKKLSKDKKNTKVPSKLKEVLNQLDHDKPIFVKCGLNHVTTLVERCKAQLVVIAHDVDPIELVVWLPALCRKKKVPYCIVKSKSRLGALVHKKTATCLALTNVRKEDRSELDSIIEVVKSQYNDNEKLIRQWSVPKFGIKHRQAESKRLRRLAKSEQAKTTA